MHAPAFLAKPSADAASTPEGVLQVIRCEPDPFTGELINVGVFGVDRRGERFAQIVEQPGRLECLYGQHAGEILFLATAAREAALAGGPMPSPQLRLGDPMPYFHAKLADAVARAFAEMVTVALPQREREQNVAVTDEQAVQAVTDEVRKLIGLDFGLLANTPHVILQTDRGPWQVYAPLQPPQAVGTIRSADYAANTLRLHLAESVLDLECAARHRDKRGTGLFLLRPRASRRAAAAGVDAVIDHTFHRKPSGMTLEVADNPRELAELIQHWGQAYAG